MVRYLVDNELCVLQADKEGGFAVLTSGTFSEKARQAIEKSFKSYEGISMQKQKSEAKKICSRLNLAQLKKSIDKSCKIHLEVFFTVKTHKVDAPLRVIVSEHDTWQKAMARFLQKKTGTFTS